jgi:succinate dehydrogenase / fumarate reductase cytochrome b subunit
LVITHPIPGISEPKSVKDNRPINLDFTTLRLPLPAITSILHRISGVFVFAGIAVLLWLLAESLASEQGFNSVQQWLNTLWVKLLVWSVLAGLLYHLIAGIRHLLMDMDIGETLEGGRMGAKLVVIFSVLAIVLAGVWLW